MALGLKDLKKKIKTIETTSPQEDSLDKKSLRPWESYDDLESQIRTISAREAVFKARQKAQHGTIQTFEKSEQITESIAPEETLLHEGKNNPSFWEKRESLSSPSREIDYLERFLPSRFYSAKKIKKQRPGLWSFLKNLWL